MARKSKQIVHYYDIKPVDVQPRDYKDIWYKDADIKSIIPYPLQNTRGTLTQEMWYKDATLTKKFRSEFRARTGIKTDSEVYATTLPISFDIETTTYEERSIHGEISVCEGYAYHMQICIGTTVVHCSEWWQVRSIFQAISERLKLNECYCKKVLKCRIWIANMGFEFGFISHFFKWRSVFAIESRKPLTAETETGIIFQDALYISGASLESLAKMYNLPTKKTHDLDFSKSRNQYTPLTKDELYYTSCDVRILSEFHEWLITNYIKNGLEIPLTKTQMLRDSIKKLYAIFDKDNHFSNTLKNLHFPTYDRYSESIRFLYRGGYTHANCMYVDKTLKDLDINGYDFTSSYPAVMIFSPDFPMSRFTKAAPKSLDDITEWDEKGFSVVMKVRFFQLENLTSHSIESYEKTVDFEECAEYVRRHNAAEKESLGTDFASTYEEYCKRCKPMIDNGRILKAEICTVWLTELDYRIYQLFYTWSDAEILECYTATKSVLPDYVRYPIMVYYHKKYTLKKHGKKDSTEYLLSKEMVNAGYGLMCEKLHLDDILFTDVDYMWHEIRPDSKDSDMIDDEYMQDVFGDACMKGFAPPKRKLPTIWGVYTTSIARYNLLSCVYEMHDSVIYCDTDSAYIVHHTQHKDVIDRYNAYVRERNKKYIDDWNRVHKSDSVFKPIEHEVFDDIGTFEQISDTDYDTFKTLGAKRYVKRTEGETEQVIAGLPKGVLAEYSQAIGKDPFDVFRDKMCIKAAKKAHAYHDTPHGRVIYDYNGEPAYMEEMSSVGIFDIDFSMSMSSTYVKLLEYRTLNLKRKWFKEEFLEW